MKQPVACGIYGGDLKMYLKYLLNEVSQIDGGGGEIWLQIYLEI